jgi:antitoxin YefM
MPAPPERRGPRWQAAARARAAGAARIHPRSKLALTRSQARRSARAGARYVVRVHSPLAVIRIVYNALMAKILPFTEARTHLTELLDEIERVHEHVVITRNGRPSAVVMSQVEYESLIETLEILGDAQLMADLATSDEDVAAGRLIPWGKVKRELGLA